MFFKKTMFISFIIILVLSLVIGCATNSNDTAKTSEKVKEVEQKYIISIGHVNSIGSDSDKACNKFKEVLEAKTEGQIEVKVFPAEQLGSASEQIDGVRLGTQEMFLEELMMFESVYPPASIYGILYLFRDMEHLHKVLEGPIGSQFFEDMANKSDVRIISYFDRLPRNVTSKKPIKSIADVKGLKIRVPDSEAYVKCWSLLGANPTPISFGEVYTSLATGVVDAQENTYAEINDSKFYEVQDYLNMTGHIQSVMAYAISEKYLKSLPTDIQEKIKEASDEAAAFMNVEMKKIAKDYESILSKEMTFIEDVDKDSFLKTLVDAGVWNSFSGKFDEEFYKNIVNTK